MSRSALKRTRIFSLDYHCIDLVTREEDQPGLAPIMRDFSMPAGSKRDISPFPELRQQFIDALDTSKITACPGGSAGNTMYTLASLLPHRTECQLLGIIGDGAHSQTIRDSYHKAGVLLIEPPVNPADMEAGAVLPTHATACILVDGNGQSRSVTLDDGHARRWLTPDMIPDMLIHASDVVLFSASMFNKFSREVPQKILDLCDAYQCTMWLTLPTRRPLPEPHREQVRELIRTRAQLVMGNESELKEIYGAGQVWSKTIADLQLDLRLQHEAIIEEDGQADEPPCAFITRGEEGAVIVMPDKAYNVSVMHVPQNRVVNPTGAGDASFAGFLAGYLRGFPLPRCAALGVAMGAAAVQTLTTRLDDPTAVLNDLAPELQILLTDA